LGVPGRTEKAGELMDKQSKDCNGHEIAKQFFSFIEDAESNERNENEEEETDGQGKHAGAQQELWSGRKPVGNHRRDSDGAFPVLHGSKRR